MRIVKAGRTKEKETFRGQCGDCGAVVEAVRCELSSVEYDQREDGEFGRGECPQCRGQMIFYPRRP